MPSEGVNKSASSLVNFCDLSVSAVRVLESFTPSLGTKRLTHDMIITASENTMNKTLDELRSLEELDQALSESTKRPVLLFKHSLTCPISTRAFQEFQTYLEAADSRVAYKLITVQTARQVSGSAADKLGVTHQSPQAILVRNGESVWSASHFDITSESLGRAISDAVISDPL